MPAVIMGPDNGIILFGTGETTGFFYLTILNIRITLLIEGKFLQGSTIFGRQYLGRQQ